MKILSSSWSELSAQTIVNCFRKVGISDSSLQLAQCDADDPFKDLEIELYHLKEFDPTAVQDDFLVENFVSAGDNNVDDDKLHPGDIDFNIEGPKRSLCGEIEGCAMNAIKNASLSSSQHGEEINSFVTKMQNLLRCTKVENLKQQTLTSYFHKL